MAHPHEMNEEPTQPNPFTPRKPVQQWKDASGQPHDTAIEAIESDLISKAGEIHEHVNVASSYRRQAKEDRNQNSSYNFRTSSIAASKAVRELELLCIEYRLQLAQDEREAKR